MKLYLVKADEIDGEHERLIEFLVSAKTLKSASAKARKVLRGWWMCRPDSESTQDTIVFFGGEIVIKRLSVSETTPEDAIRYFTKG